MECENFVKLDDYERRKFFNGELVCIEHPTKGLVLVDGINIYVNTLPLTEEFKKIH